MKPIEELKMEHEAVKVTLEILDKILSEAKKTDKIANPTHMKELLEFFQVFVDKCHYSKEEDLLFPALQAVGVSKEEGPIGVMLHEHQLGRDYVEKMNAALLNYEDGVSNAIDDLIKSGRAYISLLVQHIDKEDNVLFLIADKHLSIRKQDELLEGFDQIETHKIGTGKHDEFHAMIESLSEIYLK